MLSAQVVEAVLTSRCRSQPTQTLRASSSPHPLLPPALESLFRLIAEPILKLEAAPDGQRAVREIGLLLGDVLDWLEEDQTILHAADRLYEAAFSLKDARERRSTCVTITDRTLKARAEGLPVALAIFRASLSTAKPNARARARRLTW